MGPRRRPQASRSRGQRRPGALVLPCGEWAKARVSAPRAPLVCVRAQGIAEYHQRRDREFQSHARVPDDTPASRSLPASTPDQPWLAEPARSVAPTEMMR